MKTRSGLPMKNVGVKQIVHQTRLKRLEVGTETLKRVSGVLIVGRGVAPEGETITNPDYILRVSHLCNRVGSTESSPAVRRS